MKLELRRIVARIRRHNARIRDRPTTRLDLSLAMERDEHGSRKKISLLERVWIVSKGLDAKTHSARTL